MKRDGVVKSMRDVIEEARNSGGQIVVTAPGTGMKSRSLSTALGMAARRVLPPVGTSSARPPGGRLALHHDPQNPVDAGLIASAVSLEPIQHVRVKPDR